METIRKPKRWGNSIGITIPNEIIEKEGITLKDDLIVDIRKKDKSANIKSLFGKFKFKEGTQKIKDEMKKGW